MPAEARARHAQASGAEVFVDVGPKNAVPSAGNFPVLTLGGRGVEQARNQTSRTLITRPSRRDTLSASSVKERSSTRSSAVIAEELIPCLSKPGSIVQALAFAAPLALPPKFRKRALTVDGPDLSAFEVVVAAI